MDYNMYCMKRFIIILLTALSCFILSAEVRIHMENEGGVYKVPCTINGLKLKFIFDTGATNVCMSQAYAEMMLENGYLNESDLIGMSQSTIADGSSIDNIIIMDWIMCCAMGIVEAIPHILNIKVKIQRRASTQTFLLST